MSPPTMLIGNTGQIFGPVGRTLSIYIVVESVELKEEEMHHVVWPSLLCISSILVSSSMTAVDTETVIFLKPRLIS